MKLIALKRKIINLYITLYGLAVRVHRVHVHHNCDVMADGNALLVHVVQLLW